MKINVFAINRMLNKRIKDKTEDVDRLTKELESDAKKRIELEEDIEVCEAVMPIFVFAKSA